MGLRARTAMAMLAATLAMLLVAEDPRAAPDQIPRDAPTVAYYQALALWASGRQNAGTERLLELDLQQPVRFDGVARAGDLARGRPEVLVPVLAAHAQLHALELERAARSPSGILVRLAAGQRRVIGELAELFLRRIEAEGGGAAGLVEARQIVARLWCWVAATLRARGELDGASELFERAIRLDPQLAGAHHALGALEEKLGRYAAAARHLERVLEIAPDHHEARLRLALCRARDGRRELAGELLARLTGQDAPGWVRALAYEEQAQLHLRAGRGTEALAILAAARRALPPNDRLGLLELYALSDHAPESEQLLAQLLEPRRFTAGEATPRALYNRWPTDLETTLVQFETDAETRRPALAEATRRWGDAP